MSNDLIDGISAVIHCSANVEPQRLRNCLRAIRRQEFDQSKVEIFVGCVYERGQDVSTARAVASEFEARLVSIENWCPDMNTALARNLGARRATRLITAFTDVDAVTDPEAFVLAYPLVKDGRYAIFVRHYHMDQPPDSEIYRLEKDAFRVEQQKSTLHDTNVGGSVFLLTSQIRAIRGYDERMFGWGAEDHDILARIGRNFHPQLDCLPVWNMHQYHEHRKWRLPTFFERNFKILIANEWHNEGVRVNRRAWGGVPVSVSSLRDVPLDLPPENGPFGRLNPVSIREEIGASYVDYPPKSILRRMVVASAERDEVSPDAWKKEDSNSPVFPGDHSVKVVWDVGARCGSFSVWAASRFPKAKVHSFEPCSILAQIAYENMASLLNVEVHRFGLRDGHTGMVPVITEVREGTITLRTDNVDDTSSTNDELFWSMEEAFKTFAKHPERDGVDIVRFAKGTNPSVLIAALSAENIARIRFVQTKDHDLTDGHFDPIASTSEDGIRWFRNKVLGRTGQRTMTNDDDVQSYGMHFAGQLMQHNFYTYHVISRILLANPQIQSIIEIGTGHGALTLYLKLWAARLGVEMHTFDVHPFVQNDGVGSMFDRLGIHRHIMDATTENAMKVVKEIISEKPTYIVCDGGNKALEFSTYAPLLPHGSIISAHDWGPAGEIRPQDVERAVKEQGLVPFEETEGVKFSTAFGTWVKP